MSREDHAFVLRQDGFVHGTSSVRGECDVGFCWGVFMLVGTILREY